ncbi:DUF4352 domain-containing protein [Dietzia sp. CH92]|uniref:DUF4352 domain-containing protein n=1 Tax=Dietzia sp. CH92 TaxID=3051823 RepID=UPI0028D48232|nr:DUF4352 domain-containing protein [Dietzia sp. CH92]
MSSSAPQRKGLPATTLYVLIGALLVIIALLAVILVLLLGRGAGATGAVFGGSASGAEPGSGPAYKGKRPSDIGANFGETVVYNDVEISASPLEFNPSKSWYSRNAYCTTVTLTNNADEPLEVGPSDFALHTDIGKTKTPNELNEINRLEDQLVPAGGSTLGSLCYAVTSDNEGDDDSDFIYEGVGLGGTRIGWTSGG